MLMKMMILVVFGCFFTPVSIYVYRWNESIDMSYNIHLMIEIWGMFSSSLNIHI